MDIVDASCLAIQVAKTIYELYQTAKSNKDKCALLGKVSNQIALLLEDNFGNRQKAAKWLGNKVVFDRIETIKFHLQNAEDMIRKYTSKQGLETGLLIINAFNIDAKFQQMIEDLKDAEQQLVQAISLKVAVQSQGASSQGLEEKHQLIQEFMQAAEQDRKRDSAEIQRMLQVLQSDSYTALQKQQAIEGFVQSSEQDRKKDSSQMQQLLQILQSESVSMVEKQRCIQQFLQAAEEERKKDSAEFRKLLEILQSGQVASWEKQRSIHDFLVSAEKDRKSDSSQMQRLVISLRSDSNSLLEKQTSIQSYLNAVEQELKKEFGEIQALFQVLQTENKATWEKQRSIHEFVVSAEQKREQDADQMMDILHALRSDNTSILEKQRYMEAFLQSLNKDRKENAEQAQKLLQVLQKENMATWEKQHSIHEFVTMAEEERKRDSRHIKKQLEVMHQSEKQTLESIQRRLEDMSELLLKQSIVNVSSSSPTTVAKRTTVSSSMQDDRDFSFFIEPQHIEYEVSAKKTRGDNRIKLGQGGFGTVYKAKLRRALVVAVKVMVESAHSKAPIEELKREIRIMSRLSHRNIIGFYGGYYPLQPRKAEDDEDDEEAYIVMELAENKSFAHYLFSDNNSSMTIQKKIEILSGVADGLCYLHFRNIVHRDIKPDNVLLDRQFVAKLSDFGLSKIKETSLSSRSQAGAVGTLGYQSPEAMQSEKTSFPADIWSFGIMMIECIINERVYAGMNMTQVVATVCVNKKVPLEKIKPYESQWPHQFLELIKSCLRFDMNRRPTSIDLSVVMRGIVESFEAVEAVAVAVNAIKVDEKEPPQVSAVASLVSLFSGSTQASNDVNPKLLSASEIEGLFQRGEDSYYGKNGNKVDYARTLKYYREAAHHGHAKAQCSLGKCYKNGHGVIMDVKQAVEWYGLAANQGYADAQYNLGVSYEKGQGVAKDNRQAVEWYRLAASQGHAMAQLSLAMCFENGLGVVRDVAEAKKWYQLAADQGNSLAKEALVTLVSSATGPSSSTSNTANTAAAVPSKLKKLSSHEIENLFDLGQRLGLGAELDEDHVAIANCFRQAADHGHAGAQYRLGNCYQHGKGVTKDLAEAKKWYQLAADQGNSLAKKALSFFE